MKHVRQLVATLLVLAVAALLPAPLMAFSSVQRTCPMMEQEAMEMSGDCCDHDTPAAETATQCHDSEVALPADDMMSSKCCDLTKAPASNPTQLSASNHVTLDVDVRVIPHATVPERSADATPFQLASYSKPVFELKTDLRI